MEWVDHGLNRSDEYWDDQAAVDEDRFPKKLRAGFIFHPSDGIFGWPPHIGFILQ